MNEELQFYFDLPSTIQWMTKHPEYAQTVQALSRMHNKFMKEAIPWIHLERGNKRYRELLEEEAWLRNNMYDIRVWAAQQRIAEEPSS